MLCQRCGVNENSTRMEQRKARGSALLCVSCAAKPAKTVKTDYGICEPWQGRFDDYDNPLTDAGILYRPGFRKCGKTDCVNVEHIIALDEAELERNDLSYRTGVKVPVALWLNKLNRGRLK